MSRIKKRYGLTNFFVETILNKELDENSNDDSNHQESNNEKKSFDKEMDSDEDRLIINENNLDKDNGNQQIIQFDLNNGNMNLSEFEIGNSLEDLEDSNDYQENENLEVVNDLLNISDHLAYLFSQEKIDQDHEFRDALMETVFFIKDNFEFNDSIKNANYVQKFKRFYNLPVDSFFNKMDECEAVVDNPDFFNRSNLGKILKSVFPKIKKTQITEKKINSYFYLIQK